MMDRLSRREKILLLLAFVGLIFGLYYYFPYQWITEDQEIVQQDIAQLETEIQLAQERIEQIPELEEELARLEEERSELLEAAIREPEEILAALNVFSRRTDMTINSYSKGQREDGHPLTLNYEGDYFPLLEMMRMIDEWDYRLVVEEFSVTANDADNEDDLNIAVNFFFHQPDELAEFIAEEGE